jgi:hypothetical protein
MILVSVPALLHTITYPSVTLRRVSPGWSSSSLRPYATHSMTQRILCIHMQTAFERFGQNARLVRGHLTLLCCYFYCATIAPSSTDRTSELAQCPRQRVLGKIGCQTTRCLTPSDMSQCLTMNSMQDMQQPESQ